MVLCEWDSIFAMRFYYLSYLDIVLIVVVAVVRLEFLWRNTLPIHHDLMMAVILWVKCDCVRMHSSVIRLMAGVSDQDGRLLTEVDVCDGERILSDYCGIHFVVGSSLCSSILFYYSHLLPTKDVYCNSNTTT